MKKKIKVCVLIDDVNVETWVYDCISGIINSNHSEIVLYVKNNTKFFIKTSIFRRIIRAIKNHRNLLFHIYSKIDKIIFKKYNTYFKIKSISSLINTDLISVTPIQTKYSDRFDDKSIKEIKKYDIDVILRFGFRILRGDILTKCSQFGVWSFHHGDYKVNRGQPAGFWEFLENHPYTGITLQILNEELDNGKILYQTYSSTNTNSTIANRSNYYPNSNKILLRTLSDLFEKGSCFFDYVSNRNQPKLFYSQPLYTRPANTEIIGKLFYKVIYKIIKKLIDQFYVYQWILSYSINKSSNQMSGSFYRFKNILPPKDRFWADPFVIKNGSRWFLFFEELIFNENKGHISCIELDERGNISEPTVVLDKNYHLSYPFLIEEKNQIYMIPETYENKTIELYKCIKFPDKWELHQIIMEGVQAVDTTIFKFRNKFWMFTNMINNSAHSTNEDLYLYFSDSLFGEWSSHPMNPIVSDIRNSRPAGKIFETNGKIYRPAQDCAIRYGHSIRLNEIIKITEDEYEEIYTEGIEPNWSSDLHGVHTINNVDNITVIDCLRKRRRFFG